MPDEPDEQNSSPLLKMLLGEIETPSPPVPEFQRNDVMAGRLSLARILNLPKPFGRDSVETSHLQHLSDNEFKTAFENLLERLDIQKDAPEQYFWARLAAALLSSAPEFRRPKGRPTTRNGGMAYQRYRALVRYRSENPPAVELPDIEVARLLRKQKHRLFSGYSDATLQAEVAEGKRVFTDALKAIAKLQAGDKDKPERP